MSRTRPLQDLTTAIVFLFAFVGLPILALSAFQFLTGLLSHPL